MIKLAPSILSADFAELGRDIKEVSRAGAHYLHIDVMDGMFVPNITIGPPVISCLRKVSSISFDVHLMIEKPERYIKHFYDSGADIITVHAEACDDLLKTVKAIKALGIKAGVTIKPKTGINVLLPLLKYIDLTLIMTVEPGFGGQPLIPDTLCKIKTLRDIVSRERLCVEIEVDGGITINNVNSVIAAGADVIVAGSAIFNEKGAANNTAEFLKAFDSIKCELLEDTNHAR